MTVEITSMVLRACFATPEQKLVALLLAENADDDGNFAGRFDMSSPRLAEFACTDPRTARFAFLSLVEAGVIDGQRFDCEALQMLAERGAAFQSTDPTMLLVPYTWAIERADAAADAAVRAHIAEALRKKQSIPDELRQRVFMRDGWRCKGCGSRYGLEVDHIHPESKGGTLAEDNLQTLCRPCNARKGAQLP